MTLRAYRPNEPTDQNGNPNDWQDTLLDRPMNTRSGASLRVSYGSEPKSKLWLITGVFAVAAILVTGYFVMRTRSDSAAIPLIQADSTPYKLQPDQPGGAEIPFQDKLVFNRLDPNGKPVQAEKLLPPPEEPMATSNPSQTVTRSVTAPPVAKTTTTTTETPVVTATAPAPAAAPTTAVTTAPVTEPVTASTTTVTTTTPTAVNPKTGTASATPPAATTTTTVTDTAEPAIEPAPKVVTAAPVAKPVVSSAPTVATTTPTATPATGGQVRIQLASIPDAANAQKALPTLSSKYQSALGSTKLNLVKADIPGKGTYWRVQSQPMDKATADRVCTAVKAQGGVCITAK